MGVDPQPTLQASEPPAPDRHDPAGPEPPAARLTRRRLLRYGVAGAACAACGGGLAYHLVRRAESVAAAEVFRNDAPKGKLWEDWQRQGWVKEARHYLKLGDNVQCRLCPNECLLAPEDRGRCRDRVHKQGKLYTLAYGNPCSFQNDPVEKKPLLHFLPDSWTLSIATPGCGFRCLNCQNWSLSQRKPEELKDPRGEPYRLTPRRFSEKSAADAERGSLFPDDVVALAKYFECASIAYTYSEPTVWFEYMVDTAEAARAADVKNIWVTCGYIQQEPLVELCHVLDAANVDLKSFDDDIYRQLNSGKLEPILATLKTLKRDGVWFEVTNLVVPGYTDKLDMIRRMCGWMVENLGPDYPLHFSRFHPQHKLTHLPPTPVETLRQAREIARQAGLNYVYVGNCPEVDDAETTFCPGCKRPVVERRYYSVQAMHLRDGRCTHCDTKIAGVWKGRT
jgi:pyruvate formate lyase activating enzyme